MHSIQSKIFNDFLRLFNIKALIYKTARSGNQSTAAFFSKGQRKKFNILTTDIDNREVSVMGKDLGPSTHVIYFHGGMYTLDANSGHKRWMIHLFEKADCKVTFVDYPLAPETKVVETIEMVVHTYQFLTGCFPEDNFVLMGDSAGGGLALVLAQYLRDHHFGRRPGKLILYSPWVRLDMQNPALPDLAEKDLILDIDELEKSARAYAGEHDLSHPFLSPYYASCDDLGEIHVFYGSDELLAPDIRLLDEKCQQENVNSAFCCYPGMQHDFQLFTFLPESKDVMAATLEILKGNRENCA